SLLCSAGGRLSGLATKPVTPEEVTSQSTGSQTQSRETINRLSCREPSVCWQEAHLAERRAACHTGRAELGTGFARCILSERRLDLSSPFPQLRHRGSARTR